MLLQTDTFQKTVVGCPCIITKCYSNNLLTASVSRGFILHHILSAQKSIEQEFKIEFWVYQSYHSLWPHDQILRKILIFFSSEKQNEQCEITKRKVLFKNSHAKGHRGEIQEKLRISAYESRKNQLTTDEITLI